VNHTQKNWIDFFQLEYPYNFITSSCLQDKEVRLWDMHTPQCQAVLTCTVIKLHLSHLQLAGSYSSQTSCHTGSIIFMLAG
jgi:hypothetical protein